MLPLTSTMGIDVSKSVLDVCIFPDIKQKQFNNDNKGISSLIQFIKTTKPSLLLFEPSGGYEGVLQGRLLAEGLPCAKINPRQIREFARCTGRLAKTDQLDAQMLARYGATIKPEFMLEQNQNEELTGLTKRRSQLVEDLVREKNRLEKKPCLSVCNSIKRHIEVLETEIKSLEKDMSAFIASSETLFKKSKILTSVYGVGINTAAILLAELPELGKIDHKPIASLAGLAPHNCDSGSLKGKRMIYGGRISVRCALYMAAMTAIRKEGFLRDFYYHLKKQGKPSKVALTAAMRKLLIRLNAKMRDEFYSQ